VHTDPAGMEEIWLRLTASTSLAMTCQRCLGVAQISVHAQRESILSFDEKTRLELLASRLRANTPGRFFSRALKMISGTSRDSS